MKHLFNGRSFSIFFFLVLFLAAFSCAEKSLWQKFVDFFTPGEIVDCSGPSCEELRSLDEKISKVEGRYSRERRPVNKERIKKELDSLNVVRDSLANVVKAEMVADSLAKLSSSVALSSSSQNVPSSSSVENPTAVCAHDTVYVRDTVVVHDTLYVVLANKPVSAPVAVPDSSAVSNVPAEPANAAVNPVDPAAPAAEMK